LLHFPALNSPRLAPTIVFSGNFAAFARLRDLNGLAAAEDRQTDDAHFIIARLKTAIKNSNQGEISCTNAWPIGRSCEQERIATYVNYQGVPHNAATAAEAAAAEDSAFSAEPARAQLSMQPRLQSSRLRDKPPESSPTLAAGTKAVALLGITYRCACCA